MEHQVHLELVELQVQAVHQGAQVHQVQVARQEHQVHRELAGLQVQVVLQEVQVHQVQVVLQV